MKKNNYLYFFLLIALLLINCNKKEHLNHYTYIYPSENKKEIIKYDFKTHKKTVLYKTDYEIIGDILYIDKNLFFHEYRGVKEDNPKLVHNKPSFQTDIFSIYQKIYYDFNNNKITNEEFFLINEISKEILESNEKRKFVYFNKNRFQIIENDFLENTKYFNGYDILQDVIKIDGVIIYAVEGDLYIFRNGIHEKIFKYDNYYRKYQNGIVWVDYNEKSNKVVALKKISITKGEIILIDFDNKTIDVIIKKAGSFANPIFSYDGKYIIYNTDLTQKIFHLESNKVVKTTLISGKPGLLIKIDDHED